MYICVNLRINISPFSTYGDNAGLPTAFLSGMKRIPNCSLRRSCRHWIGKHWGAVTKSTGCPSSHFNIDLEYMDGDFLIEYNGSCSKTLRWRSIANLVKRAMENRNSVGLDECHEMLINRHVKKAVVRHTSREFPDTFLPDPSV